MSAHHVLLSNIMAQPAHLADLDAALTSFHSARNRPMLRANVNAMGFDRQSCLATILLELCAWGLISAPLVQQIAHASKKDGLKHPEIDFLAQLGTSGEYKGNCRRDLFRKLNKHVDMPKPIYVNLPHVERTGGADVVKTCDFPLYLPNTGHSCF